ncbi:ATP-binding protein [Salicola sp. Rm-C-2C1-2]|uniref:ATP-binding protein n=1 Tax=Salicola sp. Rm-C-2C1-2 TaxID=3141321 RepID=UPI0032E450FB
MTASRSRVLIGTLILIPLAIAGNMATIPLFFGVDLIFGSVAVVIAAMLLGVIPAALVAAAGGLYTVTLWGHPYALIIFIAEAIVVAWLYHRKKLNPVVGDALFWLIAGAPLVYGFYNSVMGMPAEAVTTILFKQPLNGIFNALLAGTVIMFARLLGATRGFLSGQGAKTVDVFFYAFFSLVLIAGAAPIIYEAHSQLWEEQERMSQQLAQDNQRLIAHFDDKHLNYHRYWTSTNKKTLAQGVLVGKQQTILKTGTLNSLSEQGELRALDANFGVWLPAGDMSQMQRWRQGRYVHRAPVGDSGDITAVVSELPAASVVDALQEKYTTLFALLTLILTLGVIAALILSRFLTTPIRALTEASEALDQRITDHETIELPSSNIIEFNQLSETLGSMSRRLSQSVAQLRQSREAVQQEVAERTRELDETTRLLRNILEAATELAIIATDPRGQIILFNSGAERLLGYSASELNDCTPAIFHDPDEIPETDFSIAANERDTVFSQIVAKATEKGLDAQEWTYLRKDGARIPVWLTITPIHSDADDITGYLGIAEDITERKRLDRMKNEFISTVSHELRTPLTSIAGALGLITQGGTGELPAKAQKMANVAYRNTQQLSALVNDLLDMEKLVSGKVRMTLCEDDIRPITREAVENHLAFANPRNVTLETREPDAPVAVSVDKQRFAQALSNLISNAIKFSPSGGRVIVDFQSDAHGVAVQVHDEGPGIPDHFQPKIFQRFSQADTSDNRKQPGTGLGLAITKELMTQMGGNAAFESVEGQGSTFWLWLPQQ